MATLKVRSTTSSTITVYITGLDANYDNKERNIYWSCTDNTVYVSPAKTTIANKISETQDVTLSGFSAGKTYTVKATIAWYSDDAGTETNTTELTASATTKSASSSRPKKFSWTLSTVSQGEDAIIYTTDWNDLTENINDVRKYKGLSSYTFTVAEKNNDFTAEIFNEAVSAIQGISGYGTSLSKVSKGDSFTAKIFDDLVSSINSVS